MIDINLLRGEQASSFKENILKKDPSFPIEELIELDLSFRSAKNKVESLQAEKNKISQAGKNITESDKIRSSEISKSLLELEPSLRALEAKYMNLLLCCPNFLDPVVPSGNKESNKVVRSWLKPTEFAFLPKNHVELNASLKWFDFNVGSQIAESGFVFYNEFGAKLIYALTKMMLRHNKKWGFSPVIPPYLVKDESLWKNGSLPKFKGDYYEVADSKLSLTPTAEVCLTNVHSDKTYAQEDLPIRNCAWTSCFRKEAGGYGSGERGLIRIHQFEKVEIYSVCEPEKSNAELERMVACAEEFLQQLNIPYQVSLLAAQDCSFVSTKTFDIEVWLPGQNRFYEVSSCSNCTDFQARRAKIKFKRQFSNKPDFVHTLNASSLALPRLIVALMENNQTATGDVVLPQALQEEINNLW